MLDVNLAYRSPLEYERPIRRVFTEYGSIFHMVAVHRDGSTRANWYAGVFVSDY